MFAFSLLLLNQVGGGKNLSDLLGALFKLAYLRAVATSDPTAASAQSISEIIALTRPKLAFSSDKLITSLSSLRFSLSKDWMRKKTRGSSSKTCKNNIM